MELIPEFQLVWLGGWLPMVFSSAIQWGLMLSMPKEVYARLFDRQGWSIKQKFFFRLGKLVGLVSLILIAISPLKFSPPLFIIGIIIYLLGVTGLIISLLNYRDTPMDQPVTKGLYKISRHPQIVSTTTIVLGISLMIGSWMVLMLLLVAKLLEHFGILAEEEACLKQYGDSYRVYLEQIPRYFIFF